MKGIREWGQRVDLITVRAIELMSPGSSTMDAQIIHGQILGGIIFSSFSHEERSTIWNNILAFKGIIPTLRKFFQDVILLRACVNAMSWLVSVPSDKTLFATFERCHSTRADGRGLQHTGRTASPLIGYLELFVFALSYHQELPKPPVKKNPKTVLRVKADPKILQRFAIFAFQLGFESDEIKRLKGDEDPPLSDDTQEHTPLLVTTGLGESLNKRCGLPHTSSFEEDKKQLSLRSLCEDRHETGESITSFSVLRSWFAAFFDTPRWTRGIDSSRPPLLSNYKLISI